MSRKLTLMVIFALTMCVLAVPVASTTFASESPSAEYYNVQYGFSYEETVTPTNQIVRKYEKPSTFLGLNNTGNSVTKTKAILGSLGMGEDFIDELSTERLNEYANSKSIIATTSYIKTTPEGVSTYITKQEAEEGSRAYDPPAYDCIDDGGGSLYWSADRVDEYMELVLVVSYRGNATYHISVDAEWLTGPWYYLTDSLGACMQDCTVVPMSRTGWIRWTAYHLFNGEEVVTESLNGTPNVPDCDFQIDSQGSWDGTAATFSFPNMAVPGELFTAVYNYKAHVEFDAELRDPQLEKNIGVAATYSHSRTAIVGDPSIGISLSGDISIGLINILVVIDNRSVILPEPINYIPD